MSNGMGPEQSAIEVNQDIRTALERATTVVEIQEVMREAALNAGLVVRDVLNPSVLIPTERATQAPVQKAVVVNGTEYTLTGDSDEDLAVAELKLYRDLGATDQSAQQVEPHGRGSDGRFVNTDDAGFQRGWSEATEAFKSRNPQWSDFASVENQRVMSEILTDNNLLDSEDKLAAMEAAYRHGVENDLFKLTPEAKTASHIREASSFEDLRSALGRSPYSN